MVDDDELNRWLARSEAEEELFASMDVDRVKEEGETMALMADESELPAWVLAPEQEAAAAREVVPEELGRGHRSRKSIAYDDGLTEREWLAIVDGGKDVNQASSRKRSRRGRKRKKATEDGESQGPSEEKSSKRGRGSTPSTEMNSTDDEADGGGLSSAMDEGGSVPPEQTPAASPLQGTPIGANDLPATDDEGSDSEDENVLNPSSS